MASSLLRLTACFYHFPQTKAAPQVAQGRRSFFISRPAFSDSLSVVSHVVVFSLSLARLKAALLSGCRRFA